MAAGALGALVAALESYRGRDRVVRALCYGCQLAGGALAGTQSPAEGLPGSLLAVSAQLSSCRTVLRLLDDFAMLSHSRAYGLGPKIPENPVPVKEEAEAAEAHSSFTTESTENTSPSEG
ncbi:peroxisomal membrane protein 11C isoform 2 [Gallus gallus]|uniref:peroxisomal membrane protein 11C isoform 2 n=1 Tax=Gallus gallus TaxID=9031 RepID=UPI001D13F16E|nr:peroxisomal membrane protein 11C isoform 2 [Gallus gallus]